MKIMSFDLSSKCIGCVSAEVIDQYTDGVLGKKVMKIYSAPIIPPQYKPTQYKKRQLACKDKLVTAWALPGENSITQTVKRKRDVQVRNEKDVFVLAYISKEIDSIISFIKPNLIIVEKNEIFNGVLTSVLLAKIMGVLHGIAGSAFIPVQEFRVGDVRKPYDVTHLILDFASAMRPEELRAIPDITKRAIRRMLEVKYDITFSSDDEGDACLVLDYFINHSGRL